MLFKDVSLDCIFQYLKQMKMFWENVNLLFHNGYDPLFLTYELCV